MLHYNVDKPESSYAQVRIIARKKEREKFHEIVYLNYKFDEIIYLLDVMTSVHDKVDANQSFCDLL